MKRFVLAIAVAGACLNAGAQNSVAVNHGEHQTWLSYLLPETIGTRVTYSWLTDGSRDENNTFLGSIDQLGERHYLAPDKIYGDWGFCKYCFGELTWD